MTRADGASPPKVSVCLVTYDQEEFVAQAIESVLTQETSFDYEVVIGEDCSTDRTGEVVDHFARLHPERVRVHHRQRNLGLLGNFVRTFRECRGEHVALLDGDDYWTHPSKLERQSRFLDEHPDFALCFHDAAVLLPDGTFCETNYTHVDQPAISTVEDLFQTNFIATCSAMVRREAVPALPEWFESFPWEDWPLYILYAERGKIGYLPEPMGVYRSRPGGLWSGLDPASQLERVIDFLVAIDERLEHRYAGAIRDSVSRYRARLAALRPAGHDADLPGAAPA